MRTLQLYGAGSATATSVAQVTIPASTTIKGVKVCLLVDSVTDNADVSLELSKVPTNQVGVNGAVDPFLQVGASGNFATSGLAQTLSGTFIPLAVPCRQGEIIYLHATVTGTLGYKANFIFDYA
jgi:hypothetical protein